MDKRPLAVSITNENQNVSVPETIDAIKDSGFENAFIQWYDQPSTPSQEEQLEYAREKGLNVIFAHLGYQNINSLWVEGDEGDGLTERFVHDISNCASNGITLVIMHLVSYSIAPKYNEIGLKRLKRIAEHAYGLGVKIAFENTKLSGYLEYVLDHLPYANIGVCFDSGHCHAYYGDKFPFEKFKNRIFAVHLHDNDGYDDLHQIPFDGSCKWPLFIKGLNDANYTGPVTLELIYRNEYVAAGDVNSFYKRAYETAQRLKGMLDNN